MAVGGVVGIKQSTENQTYFLAGSKQQVAYLGELKEKRIPRAKFMPTV